MCWQTGYTTIVMSWLKKGLKRMIWFDSQKGSKVHFSFSFFLGFFNKLASKALFNSLKSNIYSKSNVKVHLEIFMTKHRKKNKNWIVVYRLKLQTTATTLQISKLSPSTSFWKKNLVIRLQAANFEFSQWLK